MLQQEDDAENSPDRQPPPQPMQPVQPPPPQPVRPPVWATQRRDSGSTTQKTPAVPRKTVPVKKSWPAEVVKRIAPADRSLQTLESQMRRKNLSIPAARLHDDVAATMAILIELEKKTSIKMPILAEVKIPHSGGKLRWYIRAGWLYIEIPREMNAGNAIADQMIAAYGARLDRANLLTSDLLPEFRRFIFMEIIYRRNQFTANVDRGNRLSVLSNGSFENFVKLLQERDLADMRSVRRLLRKNSASRR